MTTEPRPGQGRPSARRFGILDVMVLVAAVACGLALNRSAGGVVWYGFGPPSPSLIAGLQARAIIEIALGFLTPITCALPVLRWIGRERPLRRLMAEPGLVAGLVVAVTAGVWMAKRVIVEMSSWSPRLSPVMRGLIGGHTPDESADWAHFSSMAGLLVLVNWLALALGGRWRSRSTWIDRAGRAVGSVWIVLLPVQFAVDRLFSLAALGLL